MSERHPIPDEVLIDHLAVLAKTGAGKTYMAKGIVERLLAQKRRVCIIDPKNAWWGLKSSADGKSPGFPIVVFGGPKADVLLLAAHGKILAEAVATTHLSCIICTKGMPEGERIRFLTDFFQTLDQKNTQPLHLVLDEAHMMAPQKPLGEMQRLTHWTSELVSGGRGMGFRIMLLSQRPARLNKDVLTQCETLVAMRMTGIQDRDAVKSWIHDQADMETGKEIVASLTGLQNGEGWVWSPAKDILKRVKFPLITTYDNSKTSRDSKADDKAELAPVDLSALQDKLGKVKTEIEANDPKALKARVADLEKQLRAKAPAAAPAPVKTNARADLAEIKQKKFDEGVAAGQRQAERQIKALKGLVAKGIEAMQRKLSSILTQMARHAKAIEDGLAALRGAAAEIEGATGMKFPELEAELEKMASVITAGAPIPMATEKAAPVPRAEKRASSAPPPTGDAPEGVSQRHKAVLDAIAWWAAAGIEAPSRVQVAGKCGHNAGGGYFRDLLGKLSGIGLIAYPKPGTVQLTDAGRAVAPAYEMATQDELHRAVEDSLEARHWAMLKVLIDAYPNEISRADLAAACGKDAGGGYFRDLVGKLSGLEMVTYPRQGAVKAADWLFI